MCRAIVPPKARPHHGVADATHEERHEVRCPIGSERERRAKEERDEQGIGAEEGQCCEPRYDPCT